jgi:hypothetical protein
LFSPVNMDYIYSSLALQNDINTLTQINGNKYKIKSFDYDGKKYKKKDIDDLVEQLKAELESVNEQIKLNDVRIYQFFKKQETIKNIEPKLQVYYNDFLSFDKDYDAKIQIFIELSNATEFVHVTTPFSQIETNFKQIKGLEYKLKDVISVLLSNEEYKIEISAEVKESFNKYLSKDWYYFGNKAYYNENLDILFKAMNNYYLLLSKYYSLSKKKLLKYQAELV